ncbi:MAG: SurA N-terminal domain-containing protein, partial [Myxococcales bacterium]|nr:SurA N-terminal domain-containing protein [Myxococcales bacterium]
MTDSLLSWRRALVAAALLGLGLPAQAQTGDYIVAVVNQELVTAGELQQRLARIRDDAGRSRQPLPPPATLRKQVLDSLIDERVLVTNARENGARIEEPELDRAVANIANQNQLTLAQLRERLRLEGQTYAKFRDNLRDQMMVERLREREVLNRIRVSDADIDDLIEKRRAAAGAGAEINVAQILVSLPEGASDAVVGERRA